ncbi:MAG TPA: carboxypeptidase-like regulatory domain-containing protein [Silvibacterium sp.]|nr:carboxypeptidase-like regulatory domain-containing protein [Silvibacterium sp.]
MTARWMRVFAPLILCGSSIFAQQRSPLVENGYSIRGVVVSAKTGKPLGRAEVTLSTIQFAKITADTTGEDGVFAFENLKAGVYILQAVRRGYNTSRYDEHESFFSSIVTGPGLDTGNLRFVLSPQALIAGTVVDGAGEPVRGAQVMLYRKNSSDGLGKIAQASSQQTDDIGQFEFARLSPADYFVAVSATPWYATRPQPRPDAKGNPLDEPVSHSALDVAYPLTFYADAGDSDAATPIPVRAGDRVQLSFSLRAVSALHLRFRFPEGQKQITVWPQLMQDIFGQQLQLTSSAVSHSPGFAETDGVAPGRYDIHFAGAGSQRGEIAHADLTADTTFDNPPADPRVEVLGKLTMMDGEKLPAPMVVSLQTPASTNNFGAVVANDGTFKIDGVRSGAYELQIGGPRTAYSLVHIAVDGASIDGDLIKIGASPVNLAAVVTPDSANVSGYVKQNGKAASGAMVVLVPRDPGANRELFRRDQSNSDGSFQLRGVAPGAYTIIAIADGWSLDWGRPEVIGLYLAHGVKVNVGLSERNIVASQTVQIQQR